MRPYRIRWTLLHSFAVLACALALALACGVILTRFARAQDAQATPAQAAPAAAAPAPNDVTQNDVNGVARELWCPLCSGVRLDACELKACAQMKDVIAIKLGEGETTQSIKNYFVQQYGPQVLGEPPFAGFSWLAWLLPVAVVVGGGVFLWTRARRMMRASASASASPATPPSSAAQDAADAEYARRLDEELDQHD